MAGLLVPIHADLLLLTHDSVTAAARADFSSLPYLFTQSDKYDVNGDTPFLSEYIAINPLQDDNLILPKGVHLHWSMPDALTRGIEGENKGKFDYPQLPNRWLISRTIGGSIQQWVIESDYLAPEYSKHEPNDFKGISYPAALTTNANVQVPFRYVGRTQTISEWDPNAVFEALPELTAVGYGEPTFAALYSNCYSLFGFHDASITTKEQLAGAKYDIVGWYSDRSKDPITTLKNDPTYQTDIKQGLLDKYGWKLDIKGYVPDNILCFSHIHADIAATSHIDNDSKKKLYTVAVGNSGTEALSGLLADILKYGDRCLSDTERATEQLHTKDLSLIEQQLESIAFSEETHSLDIGAKLKESRHRRGFTTTQGGFIWTIRSESDKDGPVKNISAEKEADRHKHEADITLPDHIAHDLNLLNIAQADYDNAHEDLITLRRQLYSYWFKYMKCTYPDSDAQTHYPDIDEVKYYIESAIFPKIDEKVAETGEIHIDFTQLAVGKISVTDVNSADNTHVNTYANALRNALNKLIFDLNKYNISLSKTKPKTDSEKDEKISPHYVLRRQPTRRYWQPSEPVVLFDGDIATNSMRHGFDGRKDADKALLCHVISELTGSIDKHDFKTITDKIAKLKLSTKDAKNGGEIAYNNWTQQPWNPIILEWEVEFFPLSTHGASDNLAAIHENYPSQFVTDQCLLPENQPDMGYKDQVHIKKSRTLFSGSTILTPSASFSMIAMSKRFFKNLRASDCYPVSEDGVVPDSAYTALVDDWFKNHFAALIDSFYKAGTKEDENTAIDALKREYENKPGFSSLAVSVQDNDAIYTLLRALEKMKCRNVLSQSLGGFNEALLMHRQSFQLPIADPLAFDDTPDFDEYQKFVEKVSDRVLDESRVSPLPINNFHPIRTGAFKIVAIRIIDSFGQTQDVDFEAQDLKTITSETVTPKQSFIGSDISDYIFLPPRLTQPARLKFRWLSASHNTQEMNVHPVNSPICGWLLPNNLDQSIMVYDALGILKGVINRNGEWDFAPGGKELQPSDIQNNYLRGLVESLVGSNNGALIKAYVTVMDRAGRNIDPENFVHHQDIALLMGIPFAVVRASIGLEVHGNNHANQGWTALWSELSGSDPITNKYDEVKFPVRIGERGQLNDGVVGYWKEDDPNYIFHTTVSNQYIPDGGTKIHSYEDAPHNLTCSIQETDKNITLLVDPRSKIHATTGILPTKVITIPPKQYNDALQRMAMTFLTTPILSTDGNITLPLPREPGYAWSWLQKDGNLWHEMSSKGVIRKVAFKSILPKSVLEARYPSQIEALWQELIHAGWIVPIDTIRATIVSTDSAGRAETLPSMWEAEQSKIEYLLDELYITSEDKTDTLWQALIDSKWIEAIDDASAKILPTDTKGRAEKLPDDWVAKQQQIEHQLDKAHITPVNNNAHFEGQLEIREGWLQLKHETTG